MESLPCEGCKGLCCGPVPVTENELKKIKKKIKTLPSKTRSELENQNRYYGTCIFYDLDKDRCGIHSARPEICRKFGYYKELVCFRKPAIATKNINPSFSENHIGILTLDFTWKDFK
ncbi:YkgJ family cysteine cluster protein [Bacillus sp. NEB1478]|uniref:YkgJ family cysteine cluster protein n=1 Tax=Bacillus sp. NEB1478 TaxID=3073816 RepID=UPI002873AC9C|nr:YkgJ family cysteine cluster protein [Bacillus sp. NEB1478]WNB90923.1 YkgJ family cysteine cluster protein [Bacillus sp. NEB1478]